MKTKIVGIFVCMLLITTIIPVSGAVIGLEDEKAIKLIEPINKENVIIHDEVYKDPIKQYYPGSVPNDPDFSKQWYLHSTGQIFWIRWWLLGIFPLWLPLIVKLGADIQAQEAWEIETGNPDIMIAIIDTGVNYTHPDLAANIWNNTDEIPDNGIDDDQNGYIDDVRGWDFFYNDSDPMDPFIHGTLCAGIAGAVGNNSIGIAGVAWNCKIMPVKVFSDQGEDSPIITAEGIRYAADNGADVISMSIGYFENNKTLLDAVNYAYSKGVFICAAVGNYGTDQKIYPAASENVTAVGYTNHRDRKHPQSNYGEWVDIAAAGSLIYSASFSQKYTFLEGSSFAVPQVAGVAALLLSKESSLTPDEVKDLICRNADPYFGFKYIGTGRINAYKALMELNNQ